jgi:hypothetical protein
MRAARVAFLALLQPPHDMLSDSFGLALLWLVGRADPQGEAIGHGTADSRHHTRRLPPGAVVAEGRPL